MEENNKVNHLSIVKYKKELEEFTDFKSMPHFIVPSLNTIIDDNGKENVIREYIEEYDSVSFNSSLCIPFNNPAVFTEENLSLDPATELLWDKKKWEREKEKLMLDNLKPSRPHLYVTKNNYLKRACPRFLKLVEHLEHDPDPNFSGYYNWYYTDGCLNSFCNFDNYSLISVRNSIPGIVVISPVDLTRNDCVPAEEAKIKFLHTGNKQSVLQVDLNDSFVAVRQRNFTNLFKIQNNGELKFKKIHNSSEIEDSITSVTISDKLNGEYYSLTTSHKLKIWSPDVKKECHTSVSYDEMCGKSCDHWGNVKFIMTNNILLSNRYCVYQKDLRMNKCSINNWNLKLNYGLCDNLSLIIKSKRYEHLVYLCTTHHLYELDFRKGFTKRWKHMMKSPPLFGVSNITFNNEIVFIGNQSSNELCCIETDKANVVPFLLPSPNETITKAKFQGLCLTPSLSTRCNLSMTGITAISSNLNNTNCYVFRSNSVGDIFYQKLLLKDEIIDDNIENYCALLSKWEDDCIKSIENLSSKPLKVTSVANFENLFETVNKPKDSILNNISKKINENKKIKIDESLKFSKEKLLNMKDSLSQSLLDIWDIEDDEWSFDTINEKSKIDKDSTNMNKKVDSWLTQFSNNENHNNVFIIGLPSTSSASQVHVSFPHENINEDSLGIHFLADNDKREFIDVPKTRNTVDRLNNAFYNEHFVDDGRNMDENNDNYNSFMPNINKSKVNKTVSISTKKSKFSTGF